MRGKNLFVLVFGFCICIFFCSTNIFAVEKKNYELDFSNVSKLFTLSSVIDQIKAPEVQNPQWLKDKIAAAEAAKNYIPANVGNSARTFTYSVTTKGSVWADINEFKTQANQTLNDARGWSRMGVSFQEVESGGNFTLVLSEASQVPSYAYNICSSVWSCQVGRYVIINQDRWLYASDAWNAAGGSLRDYRHMVVNHETGHWLGHGHSSCGGSGQSAPIMQQQSISLQGCSFNPWPLGSELWTSRR